MAAQLQAISPSKVGTRPSMLFVPSCSPRKPPSVRSVVQELTENDLLLLHLPEMASISEGDRLYMSGPLSLSESSSSNNNCDFKRVNSCHASWAPGRYSLKPRPGKGSRDAIIKASLSRMAAQGSTKLRFPNNSRACELPALTKLSPAECPRSEATDGIKQDAASGNPKVRIARRRLQRRNSAASCA